MLVLVVLILVGAARVTGAQPTNDECSTATVISASSFTDTVDTTSATPSAGDPPGRKKKPPPPVGDGGFRRITRH